ncbi:MAG: DUF58 domain-containing protein [Planctomycetes bacterium]|nr:DUF58 domain-containing protein [Planctomycetota bacterium]
MSPTGRLIVLFAVAGVPFVACAWLPQAAGLGILADLAVGLVALGDLLITPAPRRLAVAREVADVLSVGARNPVRLVVANRSRARLRVELADEPPEPSRTTGLPAILELRPWQEQSAVYHLEPRCRGRNRFGAVHLRYRTRLGLWRRAERRPLERAVRILPDIRAVHRFDLLAMKNRLDEVGLRLWRLKGQGGEFDRLREYRREDEVRHVDWKATAKRDRLISREYTVERNQNLVFLLDAGGSMRNETDGISHLDLALNAIIILSYVALGQGDNVALLAFSSRIERRLGPVRGKPAIQQIVRAVYDLEPGAEASDYALACEELARRHRKRALVILVTHSLDEQHLLTISTYLRTLTTPHLLLCVFLRDRALAALADRLPASPLEAFHSAAAAELLTAQTRRIAELRAAGVLVLEVLPGALSSALINQYLDLKARHLL